MTKENLNKIAVALIEKYGTETGVELLMQLIQEMNKPAQMQIASDPTPYTPSYTPTYPSIAPNKWGYDITCSVQRDRKGEQDG